MTSVQNYLRIALDALIKLNGSFDPDDWAGDESMLDCSQRGIDALKLVLVGNNQSLPEVLKPWSEAPKDGTWVWPWVKTNEFYHDEFKHTGFLNPSKWHDSSGDGEFVWIDHFGNQMDAIDEHAEGFLVMPQFAQVISNNFRPKGCQGTQKTPVWQELTEREIDDCSQGKRNAIGGIYATSIYEFSQEISAALKDKNRA